MKTLLIRWLARRLPDCDATTRLISASMDRRITLRERIQLRLHLWICLWCARYRDQIQLLRTTVQRRSDAVIRDDSPQAASLSDEARDRMKRRLMGMN